jgi:hypothetical protein
MHKLRLKRLAACLGALALSVAVLPAISAGSSGSPYDSVNGSGWRGNLVTPNTRLTHFVVSAQNGPQGVSGSYSSDSGRTGNPQLTFTGRVTCLDVAGDQALVGGVITKAAVADEVGNGFAVGFIDNPGTAPDTVTLSDVFAPTPVDCGSEADFLFGGIPTLPFVQGNVVINDAP